MSGTDTHSLSPRPSSILFHAPEPGVVKVLACTSRLAAVSSEHSPNDRIDASVVRDGVVWHVKGRLPSRGSMNSTVVHCLRTLSINRPRFMKLQPTRIPERFLSCTHLGTVHQPPNTHTTLRSSRPDCAHNILIPPPPHSFSRFLIAANRRTVDY